mmetsp:Transcript_28264/g.89869  ORF Transcript_28264/g.89869 Transcript_28264/m.89869 type:complete len:352 (+) Transcript_28264:172-1227(+)
MPTDSQRQRQRAGGADHWHHLCRWPGHRSAPLRTRIWGDSPRDLGPRRPGERHGIGASTAGNSGHHQLPLCHHLAGLLQLVRRAPGRKDAHQVFRGCAHPRPCLVRPERAGNIAYPYGRGDPDDPGRNGPESRRARCQSGPHLQWRDRCVRQRLAADTRDLRRFPRLPGSGPVRCQRLGAGNGEQAGLLRPGRGRGGGGPRGHPHSRGLRLRAARGQALRGAAEAREARRHQGRHSAGRCLRPPPGHHVAAVRLGLLVRRPPDRRVEQLHGRGRDHCHHGFAHGRRLPVWSEHADDHFGTGHGLGFEDDGRAGGEPGDRAGGRRLNGVAQGGRDHRAHRVQGRPLQLPRAA